MKKLFLKTGLLDSPKICTTLLCFCPLYLLPLPPPLFPPLSLSWQIPYACIVAKNISC